MWRARHNLSFLLFLSLFTSPVFANDSDWPLANLDLTNSRDASNQTDVKKNNVDSLIMDWSYTTLPDSAILQGLTGSISSTPSISDGKVFFTDWSGNITALNQKTGAVIWKKSFIADISIPNMSMNLSRNTPVVAKDLVIVGNEFYLNAPLCPANQNPTLAIGCHKGDGAIVVALNKNTGEVVWRKKVDSHPAAKITGSVSVDDNVIYVPVASWEEDFARAYRDPLDANKPYPCCSFIGGLVALDLNTGDILWQRPNAIGLDNQNTLPSELRALLTEAGGKGFFGVSTYGHSPAIDKERNQIYYATAQTYTAPNAVKLCEERRRATQDGNANIPGLPEGVTCDNLNQKLKTYGNAIVALDKNSGKVKWTFFARKYDAWVHSCDAPDLGLGNILLPILVPLPLANKDNCPDLVGPDYGFGHQPMLIKRGKTDLVVAGNKDGRVFALDAKNGKLVWERKVDPGAIYGGIQFGMANDGKQIYVGTSNSHNTNRNINTPFVSEQAFRDANGMTALGLRGSLHHEKDGDPGSERPGPGNFLPFPGPQHFYGPAGAEYAGFVPDLMVGPISGPKSLWTLVNPPGDVIPDYVNVIPGNNNTLNTIAGMVTALDAKTGEIVWQRPAIDAIAGQIKPSMAYGSITVANGVVFAGYGDQQGTLVALDAKTGKKLFQFNGKMTVGPNQEVNFGLVETAPAIVGNQVFIGIGGGTAGPLAAGNAGNKLYVLKLNKK